MQDDTGQTAPIVERAVTAWYRVVRFASVGVLWALSAWPILTIPPATMAACRAWQSDAELIPWRPFWQGLVRGGKSYAIGLPWGISVAIALAEARVLTASRLPWTGVWEGMLLISELSLTVWVLYAWAAMAADLSPWDGVRAGLLAMLGRPLTAGVAGIGVLAVIAVGWLVPVAVPLLWGGSFALAGTSGYRAAAGSSGCPRRSALR
ncbi:MAG: hypothetical protein M0Z36_00010 [Thermaerobacter sp.]|nr:hypothetical protein [Thermaerobacter sp.]